jgi:hypothetical protein
MYKAPITRSQPTAFVVLIDQSGSMSEIITFTGVSMSKARAVSLVANAFLEELLYRARREEGVRDYYQIAVLGYSGEGVSSLISPEGEFTTPSRLAGTRVRRENISRERILPSGRSVVAVTGHNIWIEQKAEGSTPMCGALERGRELVDGWCRQKANARSYPPTLINITDGESSDCNGDRVARIAENIRATATADGNTILVNIHLHAGDADDTDPRAILFPSSPDELPPHRYARLLWDISSEMPAAAHDMIRAMRPGAQPPFRAMGWDSHIAGVAAMMNIGSVNSVML